MNQTPLILLENVGKTYLRGTVPVLALQDINLSVLTGEFVAVMGPSGSGKSTLMNLIGLLDRPNRGTYTLNGKEAASLSDREMSNLRNQTIGFIFQNFNLLPRITAERNVILPLVYRRLSETERRASATAALESVGLGHRLQHRPTQMSGGESQRVAIARALVGNPSLILADEPTGNLDSRTGDEILDILTGLTKQGKTLIMVTHDPRLAERADRIVHMLDGRIV
ncbi:MAG: ABC transporter ATP-binding protein [Calditrichota bacterium]